MTLSTTALFGKRTLNQLSAEDYVDWAVEMLVQGYDSLNLRILAGLDRRGSTFETEAYFLRTVKELNLCEPASQDSVRAYACELARQIIDGHLASQEGVRTFYRLWLDTDYSSDFTIWMELDDALDSLLAAQYPYTYPSANLENFDTIVKREAEDFINSIQMQSSV